MIKGKKEMEYPDAPSGYVTLYNYKEPFMKFEHNGSGYGFQGVLLFDGSTDQIQCHICGEWFHSLGRHLNREHNITAAKYKTLVGLRQTSALISETVRAKLIAHGTERFKNLIPGKKKSEAEKEKISTTLKKNPRETQNENGSCPEQLITRLQKRATELGRCPIRDEVPFETTLARVFGSFREACIVAGLNPLKKGQTLGHGPKMEKKELLDMIRAFIKTNGRNPTKSDFTRGLLPNINRYHKHFGGTKNAISLI